MKGRKKNQNMDVTCVKNCNGIKHSDLLAHCRVMTTLDGNNNNFIVSPTDSEDLSTSLPGHREMMDTIVQPYYKLPFVVPPQVETGICQD